LILSRTKFGFFRGFLGTKGVIGGWAQFLGRRKRKIKKATNKTKKKMKKGK